MSRNRHRHACLFLGVGGFNVDDDSKVAIIEILIGVLRGLDAPLAVKIYV